MVHVQERVRIRWGRIAVLVALLGVVGVVAGLVAAAAWPDPPAPIVSDAKEHPPAPTDPGQDVEACSAETLEVGLTADRAQFTEDEAVTFTVSLTNTGAVPCLVDGADAHRPVIVWAGEPGEAEPVWSSADCAEGERMLLLGPGFTDSGKVRWSGELSAPECEDVDGKLAPGGYSAQVRVSGAGGAASGVVELDRLEPPEPSPEPSKKAKDRDREPSASPEKGSAGAPGDDATSDSSEPDARPTPEHRQATPSPRG
ncbi:hypothetical protein [Myceligenerans crystallogenes]|uniref:hypothetical protein n=1 Tax=Myceligenerans crystallogenes TaxID=316335 RepID=UPI0031DA7571